MPFSPSLLFFSIILLLPPLLCFRYMRYCLFHFSAMLFDYFAAPYFGIRYFAVRDESAAQRVRQA